MPFALVLVGLIMIVSGAKNTYAQLGNEIIEDFTGPGNFVYWVVALGSVGLLGYIESIRPLARIFMALIILVMVLRNQGFFARFSEAINAGPISPDEPPDVTDSQEETEIAPITGNEKLNRYRDYFLGQIF